MNTNQLQIEMHPVQVELSVQDYFVGASTPELHQQISAETWETWFQVWMENLRVDLPPAPSYELSLRLTNDVEIQNFNAQYRNQDKPTDVLAFAALEVNLPCPINIGGLPLPLYLGDIVISYETALRQATQQQHSLSTELAWLAAHGLLHLLGWDHPDADSLNQMLEQQQILLQIIGITGNTV